MPLKRERMTIGRRADNDICLPNLAVSGEHAAIVTILADSFLEDMGSTNGTLVNRANFRISCATATRSMSAGHMLVYCIDEDTRYCEDIVRGSAEARRATWVSASKRPSPFSSNRATRVVAPCGANERRCQRRCRQACPCAGARTGKDPG